MATANSPAGTPGRRAGADTGSRLAGDAEWLLTDGAGGYACGTAGDLATRRYHGLWITRPAASARRYLVVAGLDEQIVGAAGPMSLLHAHWSSMPGPVPPRAVVTFARHPLPQWTFRTEEHVLRRSVALHRVGQQDAPRLLLQWHNPGSRPLRLLVRPLLGYCDADHLPPADEGVDATVHARGASWGFRPNQTLPISWLTVDGVAAFRAEPAWYRGFSYAIDRARGYDHIGDRWTPGVLELDLAPGAVATAAFGLQQPCEEPLVAFTAALHAAAAVRRAVEQDATQNPLRARLAPGADDFLYRSIGGRPGVLAGFPWFGEWGRDVFVSLPGLTLARGRPDECAAVLSGALPFLRAGLLPNIYGREQADSHYGSCDAALWFGLAVARYADAGGSEARIDGEYLPAIAGIAEAYVAGTELGLRVDASGLLQAGRPDLNATWMDARTHRGPVTPRDGLPVEIQALWYSLLGFLVERGRTDFAAARDRCGEAFLRHFWLTAGEYLADRVRDGVPDATVRPNMVIAAALRLSPLSVAQRAGVVARAAAELVTPRGLRTLSPNDPAYRGRYEGDTESRDAAYHQGTVWPWLAGFHVEASLRAASRKQVGKVRLELRSWLDDFLPELDRAGLDHISEVFDGDPPHRPGGTFAQAWNTGELLRALALLESPVLPDRAAALRPSPGRSPGRSPGSGGRT